MNAEKTNNPDTPKKPRTTKWWPIAIIALATPLIVSALYFEIGGSTTPDEANQSDDHNITAMVERLENRLDDNPADGEGWLMLGRSYSVMNRPNDAVDALTNAHLILGDTPEVLLEYAQALASARDQPSFSGRPAEMINQALEQAPNNPQALWLSGLAAAESGEYATAKTRWEQLLALQPPNSEDARIIRQNLEDIQARLGQENTESTTVAEADTASTPSNPSLKISVSLAPELANQVQPQDPVFIFARATGGAPMPLAVVKKQVSDLPITVTLDDSQSMMPGHSISTQDNVELVVRVSKSGDVSARSGDLQATTKTVAVATDSEIPLIIDTVIP